MTEETNKEGKEYDNWVNAAMTDNSMVAELLVRMKHSSREAHSSSSSSPSPPSPMPERGVRRPRTQISRPSSISSGSSSSKISPSMPLSWGTRKSVCAGGGGHDHDESTRIINKNYNEHDWPFKSSKEACSNKQTWFTEAKSLDHIASSLPRIKVRTSSACPPSLHQSSSGNREERLTAQSSNFSPPDLNETLQMDSELD